VAAQSSRCRLLSWVPIVDYGGGGPLLGDTKPALYMRGALWPLRKVVKTMEPFNLLIDIAALVIQVMTYRVAKATA